MAPDTIPDFDQLDAVAEPSWTFRLDGREWHTRQPEDIPLAVVESIFGIGSPSEAHPYAGAATKADGDPAAPCTTCGEPPAAKVHLSAVKTEDFFAAVLMPNEVVDFLAMKGRPGSPLTLRNTDPLIRGISEAVFARPTNRSARRARGSAKTAGTSKAASSSRATPRKRSTGAA